MFVAIPSIFCKWGVAVPFLAKWLLQPLVGKIWVLLHDNLGFPGEKRGGSHLLPLQHSIRGVTIP